MKPRLLDNKDNLFTLGEGFPLIEVHYHERKRVWRKKYEGSLQISCFYSREGAGTEVDKSFFQEWDVTDAKLESNIDAVLGLEERIFSYLDDVVRNMKLVTQGYLSDEQFTVLEHELVNRVAIVTERPSIAESYEQRKTDMVVQRETERQRVQEQTGLDISSWIPSPQAQTV